MTHVSKRRARLQRSARIRAHSSAAVLIVGSIIGTGVYALPSALASCGPISLVVFGLVTLAAVALALTFGRLAGRVPGSGGPYLYARDPPLSSSAAAQIYWLLTGGRALSLRTLSRDLVIAGLSSVFAFWALAGSGYQAAYYGMFFVILGLPVYVWLKVAPHRGPDILPARPASELLS